MRNVPLDILRGVAILLVLNNHQLLHPALKRFGWTGLDLFFVLSGFLVSGLLFREHQRYGVVRPWRFLIRRGFKIYPSYYFYLFLAYSLDALTLGRGSRATLLHEAVFLQNYLGGMWAHTWSLAVEEHFYVLVCVFVLWAVRRRPADPDPFREIRLLAPIFCVALLALRVGQTLAFPEYRDWLHFRATHIRMDSLVFGVLLSYLHHYRQDALRSFIRRHGRLTLLVSALLLLPALFHRHTDLYSVTLGFTALYLGYGGILLCAFYAEPNPRAFFMRLLAPLGRVTAWIGRHSYSIYLWHVPVMVYGKGLLRVAHPEPMSRTTEFGWYAAMSIAVGAGLTKLIETPFLRYRDAHFPTRSGKLPPA